MQQLSPPGIITACSNRGNLPTFHSTSSTVPIYAFARSIWGRRRQLFYGSRETNLWTPSQLTFPPLTYLVSGLTIFTKASEGAHRRRKTFGETINCNCLSCEQRSSNVRPLLTIIEENPRKIIVCWRHTPALLTYLLLSLISFL